jgi:hypothetical protein
VPRQFARTGGGVNAVFLLLLSFRGMRSMNPESRDSGFDAVGIAPE